MQRCLHIWNLEPSSLFIFKIFYLPLISNIPRHHYKDDRILPKNQIGQMFTFYLINRYPRKYIFLVRSFFVMCINNLMYKVEMFAKLHMALWSFRGVNYLLHIWAVPYS